MKPHVVRASDVGDKVGDILYRASVLRQPTVITRRGLPVVEVWPVTSETVERFSEVRTRNATSPEAKQE